MITKKAILVFLTIFSLLGLNIAKQQLEESTINSPTDNNHSAENTYDPLPNLPLSSGNPSPSESNLDRPRPVCFLDNVEDLINRLTTRIDKYVIFCSISSKPELALNFLQVLKS
jgi:hypothetical protein